MCSQYRIPIAELIILPNHQHTVTVPSDDKESNSKLGPTVNSLVLKGKTPVKEHLNKSVPTHSWDYDQYLESVMEDITTYETYEDPYALVDSSDGSQIEPTDTATSESDTVIPEDDASSTDRPSTPNLSPIYVPSTQVMTSQRTILPLYPDHPDDVYLYRVQNLEDFCSFTGTNKFSPQVSQVRSTY